MNVLVVFCHPVPHSYGAHLRDRIVSGLDPHRATSIDLYAGDEMPRPFDDALDRPPLEQADALVLVYPTWWSSLPAALMAWLEEALERGLLAHMTRLVAVTTHGSSRLVNRLSGGVGRRIVERGFPRQMSPGTRATFVAVYSMDRIGDEDRRRFADGVGRRVLTALT